MPHAERDVQSNNMSANGTMTNGEKASSLTLQHLQTYPVVNDSIKYYEENPYGAKSISLLQDIYNRFFVPVEPYLRGPYSYVAPYVAKADSLGDEGLKKVDSRFPIVKEDTDKLTEKAKGLAGMPLATANEGRDYLFKTYQEELKKTGNQGLIPIVKAIVYTELKVTADVFAYIAEVFNTKKEEAKKTAQKELNN